MTRKPKKADARVRELSEFEERCRKCGRVKHIGGPCEKCVPHFYPALPQSREDLSVDDIIKRIEEANEHR